MKKQHSSFFKKDISFGSVDLADKAAFARHLAMMLNAGLTIQEALDIAQETARGKMKRIIGNIAQDVQGGTALAVSLAHHKKVFSHLFINVTDAGEKSGTLAQNLEYIALQLDKEKALSQKIKGALAYPIIILIAAFFLALGMAYFVLPRITPLLVGLDIELPLTTRIVIAFSNFVQNYGGAFLVSLIAGVIILSWIVKQKFSHPITHFINLHIPLVKNIVIQNNLTRFSLTLGTLLKSGINIDEALSITHNTVGNYYFSKSLEHISERIKEGTSVGENLEQYTSLYPRLVTSMVSVGEESGNLDETLIYLAEFYEKEIENTTKAITIAIEPLLLIIIGLVVGTLALAIISPIYQVTGNIRNA